MRDDLIKDGIHFECVPGCARCCRGEGVVYINEEEAHKIATFLNISLDEFYERYTHFDEAKNRILKDKTDKVECIFLTDDYKCKIYPVRPIQCKTYPFWPIIFEDKERLNYEKLQCPGLGQGKLYTKEEILKKFQLFKNHKKIK